jgi:hypothetical protein
MKLLHLATVACLAVATLAASAQTTPTSTPSQGDAGLYFNPIAIRVSNSVADNGPFALLGQNSTSQVFYGYTMGGLYDFVHYGKLAIGGDMRYSDLHANNGMLRDFMVGVRVSGNPFAHPWKPYLEGAIGYGTTKAPAATVRVSKINYAIYAGADYTIARHVDFRALEIGYGSLTTVGSATVGAGGNIAVPASKLLSFTTGLVFRF